MSHRMRRCLLEDAGEEKRTVRRARMYSYLSWAWWEIVSIGFDAYAIG